MITLLKMASIKYITFILLLSTILIKAHVAKSQEHKIINLKKGKTKVQLIDNGTLEISVSPKTHRKIKNRGYVQYSDFNAKGDGKQDDIIAIAATHAVANQQKLPVRADKNATYYIGGKDLAANIQTDTDFGTASFIIDDTKVENRSSPIFLVSSNLEPFKLEGISTLKRGQKQIDSSLPSTCLITVTNSHIKHYIRFGLNQNNGSDQTDIFVVDKQGNVDMNAPIIWDFEQITEINALPIDEDTLRISGGVFTTIANQAPSKYTYYSRNIAIKRSNVVVDGLKHNIKEEGDHGAPYGGFINISNCAYVTIKNTTLTGHKTYQTIGAAGKPVSMGSYDLSVNRALNVSFVSCDQTNDINDKTYWGILGSNYCKNLLYDSCKLSRFDAHKGVANATIRNSELGHMGINAIGSGILTVENTTVRGRSLINLRQDYGSTWQGEFVIRDCVFIPYGEKISKAALINGYYSGQHDFGYTCYMPKRITIENLKIMDGNHTKEYKGPAIFSDFNPEMTDTNYKEKFPYVRTEEVILKDISIESGKELKTSYNPFMFEEVKVK